MNLKLFVNSSQKLNHNDPEVKNSNETNTVTI